MCVHTLPYTEGEHYGPINYTDTKAKCRHLNKFTCKGTLQQVFICLRPPPLLPMTRPVHTVYVYTVHVYLFTQEKWWWGGGGGRAIQRNG
jgi:hypothetical protein